METFAVWPLLHSCMTQPQMQAVWHVGIHGNLFPSWATEKKVKMTEPDHCLLVCIGLYAASLLQLELIVTECFPEASTSPFVLRCLQQYMQMTGSERSEALLELGGIWPSKRRRWWTVLLKADMVPAVACLFPGMMPMTDQELQELILSSQERLMFEKFGKGLGAYTTGVAQPLSA